MILSRLVNPLANLTALMQASVPEFTNLTLSILGAKETKRLAIFVSNSVGMPYEVPFLDCSLIALIISG